MKWSDKNSEERADGVRSRGKKAAFRPRNDANGILPAVSDKSADVQRYAVHRQVSEVSAACGAAFGHTRSDSIKKASASNMRTLFESMPINDIQKQTILRLSQYW